MQSKNVLSTEGRSAKETYESINIAKISLANLRHTVVNFSQRSPGGKPRQTRQSSHLQRRLYDHRFAASGRQRLGSVQRQWLGRRVDRHEPANRGGSLGTRRYRLRRRRRARVRGRDTERSAIPRDLVFLGSNLVLASSAVAI